MRAMGNWVVTIPAIFVMLSGLTGLAAAQQPLTSPYRDHTGSEIRGLSAKEVEDLREGRGMGLARAAELNGYLSPEQLRAVRQLFEGMSREARRLGQMILTEEQALEAAFRQGSVSESGLRDRISRIATLYGELRGLHLRTHLETRALLTDHQIERYNQLRGYAGAEAGHGQPKH